MFPMTVTHLEPDPPPSDMRWTAQGRPSTHPHVKSAHRTRQGAMPGSVPYATTTREIKMITVGWESSYFQPTQWYFPRAKEKGKNNKETKSHLLGHTARAQQLVAETSQDGRLLGGVEALQGPL